MTSKNNKLNLNQAAKAIVLAAFAALCSLPANAQDSSSVLFMNCELYTAGQKNYPEGALGIRNGKIEYAGRAVAAPKTGYDKVIDLKGKHVYPALIASNTTLGLTEIFAVRATNDYRESGSMNPNARAVSAYNAESEIAATVRANGVLFAQICPRGGVLSGTSSAMVLDGLNWEDAAYHTDEGLHLNWPRMYQPAGDEDDPEAYKANEDYIENLREIRDFFEKARAYSKRDIPLERDLRLEALREVFSGEKRLYVHTDFIKEIREVTLFKNDFDLPKVTLVGGYDAWMAADLLRENKVSVMVKRVNSLPRFAEDAVDAAFTLPAKLAAAGVDFCFQMAGSMEAMQNRNIAFNAGSAIGYGLDRDEALKALTIKPAEILGIDHRTGSLQPGKEANFIITSGDLFDMRSSTVEEMYYQGRSLELETKQKRLYEKFSGKTDKP